MQIFQLAHQLRGVLHEAGRDLNVGLAGAGQLGDLGLDRGEAVRDGGAVLRLPRFPSLGDLCQRRVDFGPVVRLPLLRCFCI